MTSSQSHMITSQLELIYSKYAYSYHSVAILKESLSSQVLLQRLALPLNKPSVFSSSNTVSDIPFLSCSPDQPFVENKTSEKRFSLNYDSVAKSTLLIIKALYSQSQLSFILNNDSTIQAIIDAQNSLFTCKR